MQQRIEGRSNPYNLSNLGVGDSSTVTGGTGTDTVVSSGDLGGGETIITGGGGTEEEREAFKPKLANAGTLTREQLDETIVTLSSLGLSDSITVQELAKVIADANLESRDAARKDRAARRDADMAAQQAAADKIRESANFAFAASMVQSTVSIVGAAVSIGASVKAMGVQNQASKLEAKATKVDGEVDMAKLQSKALMQKADKADTTRATRILQRDAMTKMQDASDSRIEATGIRAEANVLARQAQNLTTFSTSAQQMGSAVGQMGGSALNTFGAAEAEREKALQTAESSKQRSAAEDEGDFKRAYEENFKKTLDTLSAIQQADADINRSIIRGA